MFVFDIDESDINKPRQLQPPQEPEVVPPEQAEGYAYTERKKKGETTTWDSFRYSFLGDKFINEMFKNGTYPIGGFVGMGGFWIIIIIGTCFLQYYMTGMGTQDFYPGYLFSGLFGTVQITVVMTILTRSPHWVRATFILNYIGVFFSPVYIATGFGAFALPCGYHNEDHKQCPKSHLAAYFLIASFVLTTVFMFAPIFQNAMLQKVLHNIKDDLGYPSGICCYAG